MLRPLRKEYGELRASQFGPKRLKQLQETMVKRDWSRQYVNKATGIIKRFFAWAVVEELIPASVWHALIPVRGLKRGRTRARERPKIGPVSDQMLEATIPYLCALAADVVRVMRRTGARPSEILGMGTNEIDRSDADRWIYRPIHHKTLHHDKNRSIFIGPDAQRIILPRLMKAGADGKLFPMRRTTLTDLVYRACRKAFPHPTLSAIKPKNLTDAQKAELKAWEKSHRWHPNTLRHSFATEVRREHGLEAAHVMLGYSCADVTQVYAERDVAKARDVARRIG